MNYPSEDELEPPERLAIGRPGPVPTIASVVEQGNGVLRFRPGIANGHYSVDALTDCGHNWVHLDAWKSDGQGGYVLGVEHHGVRVACSRCGRTQAFGPAAPRRRAA